MITLFWVLSRVSGATTVKLPLTNYATQQYLVQLQLGSPGRTHAGVQPPMKMLLLPDTGCGCGMSRGNPPTPIWVYGVRGGSATGPARCSKNAVGDTQIYDPNNSTTCMQQGFHCPTSSATSWHGTFKGNTIRGSTGTDRIFCQHGKKDYGAHTFAWATTYPCALLTPYISPMGGVLDMSPSTSNTFQALMRQQLTLASDRFAFYLSPTKQDSALVIGEPAA